MRKPSPIERVAEVKGALGVHALIRQREVDHVFSGVEWLSAGLMQVQRGTKILRDEALEVKVNAGELVWIAPGTRVDIRNVPEGGDYRAEGVLIDSSLLAELKVRKVSGGPRFRRITPQQSPRLMEAHRRSIEALTGNAPADVIRFRLLELLAWVVDLGIDVNPGNSTRLALKQLFVSGPARDWKLKDVARAMAMSEDTLARRLTREKTSFQALLTEVRMDHAVSLLWTTDLPLGHIAMEVGYTSASRFTARFHERFGLLPSRLRAQR